MTSRGFSHQGEGQAHCEAGRPYPSPQGWVQSVLTPPYCVRAIVSIHTHAGVDLAYLGVELDDPHTRELLAARADPSRRFVTRRGLAAAAAVDLRMVLEEVLDPDPF